MSGNTKYADWIAVDWGTSNLRAWAMRGDEAIATAQSDKGMGSLEKSQFEAALLERPSREDTISGLLGE